MKVLLINPPIRLHKRPTTFPFGLGYIASVLLSHGHEVEVLDINALRFDYSQVQKIIKIRI